MLYRNCFSGIQTSFKREEKKCLSKALKVQMQESNGFDNSNGSTDDEGFVTGTPIVISSTTITAACECALDGLTISKDWEKEITQEIMDKLLYGKPCPYEVDKKALKTFLRIANLTYICKMVHSVLFNIVTPRKGLPPGAPIYRRREAAFDEMPFSIPLYLQLLVGLKCLSPFLNVVLPWNSAKFGESFYAEDIYLEAHFLSVGIGLSEALGRLAQFPSVGIVLSAPFSLSGRPKRNFSFTVELPNSTFTFIHQVQSIIEEVNFDDEGLVATADIAMQVYNDPPLSQEYVIIS
ncbi:hypothetical protein JHK87_024387 [Glycine soja]|nr:hypothetical protein JHK87_024387 [Glycine soja]